MRSKLALAGSAGAGKTTLGRLLADRLDVPFVEEGMRRRLDKGSRLEPEARRELIEQLWLEHSKMEGQAPEGFVSARSSLDFAAYWFHYGLDEDPDATERWMTKMCAASLHYDRILLLPWGILPPSEAEVPAERWTQFRFQSLLEGVLNRFGQRGQVLRVPSTTSLEQRVEYVMRYL